MYYYLVIPSGQDYHGSTALTYSYHTKLTKGTVVLVPMRTKTTYGIVIGITDKPKFRVKKIAWPLIETPLPESCLELINWLVTYYPCPLGVIASLFVPSTVLQKQLASSQKTRPLTITPKKQPPLTIEQTKVLKTIAASKEKVFLLHGETGSGKTRVYLEIAKKTLEANKDVLLLTPEIGLTSQLAVTVAQNLGVSPIILHSNLTGAQRRTIWLKLLEEPGPHLIIGPRSALFAPLRSIGLIVVDEAHDAAYKQDQAPYYNALRVAGKLAQLHKATLIYGSATPAVTEYYIAEAKKVTVLRMTEPAIDGAITPKVTVIDSKDRVNFSRSPYFSNAMIEGIEHSLKHGEQSLVFLNRRGTARTVVCQNGDWQALCPRCDLPLTYHGDSHIMRCHTCGYKQPIVTSCPVCSSPEIIYKSIGTKAVQTGLQHIFPDARIHRFDTDNTKTEKFENNYQAVLDNDVDILVGTQLLVKGLDLPSLSFVGVVAADTSLYFPDYTAEEQTYQLIAQVLGRVGRGHRQGSAVLQTHNPTSKTIQSAITKDWRSFYAQQLAERQTYLFPPFCHILKLTCSRKSSAAAQKACDNVITKLQQLGLPVDVVGPTPRLNERAQGDFHWQIIIKAKNRGHLLSIIPALPANISYDLDPTNLL